MSRSHIPMINDEQGEYVRHADYQELRNKLEKEVEWLMKDQASDIEEIENHKREIEHLNEQRVGLVDENLKLLERLNHALAKIEILSGRFGSILEGTDSSASSS